MIRPALLAAAFAMLVAVPSAQQKPAAAPAGQRPPVFRSGVDLVQIDVAVIDADGLPVRGLKKEDFALFDRLVKQEIAVFAEKSHEPPPADPFAAPLPMDVADNRSAKSDRLVIIVLDDLHFRGRTTEAVNLVERAVNEIGDSVTLGLVTTSGTFGVEPTEDRARLLVAVKDFLDRFDPSRMRIPQVTSGQPASPPGMPIEPGGEKKYFRYSGPDLASEFSPQHAYKTVEDVARMVGANDGRRKAFVWISAGVEGFTGSYERTCKKLGVFDGLDPISQRICAMYEKLFRSSVAVYAVSPGGPTDGAGSRPLDEIAKDTGGFSIRANDLDEGMPRLVADLDNYYLLGFYPAEPGRAAYREINVVVDQPGVTVRHRTGYHADGPVAPPKNRTVLDNLVATVSPKAELHLRSNVVPFFTSGSAMQLLTTLEVDLAELPPIGADGLMRDFIEFAAFAVDLNKKKVTRAVGRRVLLEWPEDHRKPGAERVLLQTVLTVPPGPYQLRSSAWSKTPEKTGSVYLHVDVPGKTDEQPLMLSGILVGSDITGAPKLVESKPLKGVTIPFPPSLDREFAQDETLRIFFQVHRKNTKTTVGGTVTLLDPDGVTAARLPWQLQPGAANTLNLAQPLSGVAPGAYRLVVAASDGQVVATDREVRIRVR